MTKSYHGSSLASDKKNHSKGATHDSSSITTASRSATICDSTKNNTEQLHNPSLSSTWPNLPLWAIDEERISWGEQLHVLEWEDDYEASDSDAEGYRALNGWKGSDLVHSKASPVRVLEYRVQYTNHTSYKEATQSVDTTTTSNSERPVQHHVGDEGETSTGSITVDTTTGAILTGIVHFTSRAESHKGYCHGGSMCSIMDDIIGWTGFCASGRCLPWSGYTVQVNTKLMKPVPVGRVLLVECRIVRVEGRKVFVGAKLVDPTGDGSVMEEGDRVTGAVVYAEADGLVILNRGVLPSSKT